MYALNQLFWFLGVMWSVHAVFNILLIADRKWRETKKVDCTLLSPMLVVLAWLTTFATIPIAILDHVMTLQSYKDGYADGKADAQETIDAYWNMIKKLQQGYQD